ncbi:MAG: VOC family protein [Planctomycetales bacterium]|nr:VOC family protein [Planctomycetales bacterium]
MAKKRARGRLVGNHVHLWVKDLRGALRWLAKVWGVRPLFAIPHLAVVPYAPGVVLLLEKGSDVRGTIGYASRDCDRDFKRVVARGAKVVEPPEDRPWGVRAAYLKGPGKLVFEIEQEL